MDPIEFDVGTEIGLGDHLAGRAAETGGTEVAGRFDQVLVDELLVGLDQQLLRVGVPDLNGGAVLGLGVLR